MAASFRPSALPGPLLRQQRQHLRSFQGSKTQQRLQSTLKSLDDILGSKDEAPKQEAEGTEGKGEFKLLRVPDWAWSEVREPRVVPLATNALYYTLLLVFVSYYVVQLSDGDQSADDLIARLANDHAAVADGDALRLYTCAFVADNIQALIFGLVGMATVASELESLLGYSSFWALLSLGSLTGSLADAAFSRLPITQGPGPAVAAVAGALLAYHARNWELEQQLLQIQEGTVPRGFMQLEEDYNTRRMRQQEGAVEAAVEGDTSSSSTSSSSAAQQPQQQAQAAGSSAPRQPSSSSAAASSASEPELVESDLDIPVLGWLGISFLVPKEGKAFVTLGGLAAAVLSALQEASSTDAATDWPGLVAGFLGGLALGWQVAPVYKLQLVEASTRDPSASVVTAAAAASGVGSQQGAAAAGGKGGAAGGGADSEPFEGDLLLPVLKDSRPAAARANAVVGYAAVLFAVLGGWLLQQGS